MEEKDMREALDLSGLTMFDINSPEAKARSKKEAERQAKLEAECRAKYGKDWAKHFVQMLFPPDLLSEHNYDRDLKLANTAIYNGRMAFVSGMSAGRYFEFQEKRFREIYGDDHLTLRFHAEGDPAVCELLLADAVKTGKWRELPDVLQDEYLRRVGSSS